MRNDELAHQWAHQSAPHGQTPLGAFSYRGTELFSYRTLIGKSFPDLSTALLTLEYYSRATSDHVSAARSASFYKVLNVPLVDPKDRTDHNTNLAHFKSGRDESILKGSRARTTSMVDHHLVTAHTAIDNYNHYLKSFKIKRKQLAIDPGLLEKLQAGATRDAQRQKTKNAKAMKRAHVEIQSWRDGVSNHYPNRHSFDVSIRIVGDRVETSRGAYIPLAATRGLWMAIRRAVKSKTSFTPEIPITLGAYKLSHITASGSIKVACHVIHFNELKRLATILNYPA